MVDILGVIKPFYLQLYRTRSLLSTHLVLLGKFGFRAKAGLKNKMSGRVWACDVGLDRVLASQWGPFTTLWVDM